MRVGDYVRTEDGIITKIKMFYEQKWEEPKLIYARFLCENYEIYEYPRQVKSSPNIIDLIEVGDYVNGLKITLINEPSMANCNKRLLYAEDEEGYLMKIFNEKDIKSIVTKEQFEAMEYKVGE